MVPLKISGKILVILIEYIILLALFIPFILFLFIMQLVYSAIDNSRYNAKIKNTRSYEDQERRSLTDQKIDQDWNRRKTLADRIVNYWTEHIFNKKANS